MCRAGVDGAENMPPNVRLSVHGGVGKYICSTGTTRKGVRTGVHCGSGLTSIFTELFVGGGALAPHGVVAGVTRRYMRVGGVSYELHRRR